MNQKQDLKYEEINSLDLDFTNRFDLLEVALMSREEILSISQGEVYKTDTLNYRTLKPERGGIFCAAIFGPIEDFKCLCKKYSGEQYKGVKCDKCDVLVQSKKIRRLRFGHIDLKTVVVHPWFYNHICNILKISKKLFTGIINFEIFIFCTDSEDGEYKKLDHFSANDYYETLFFYDEILSGGEAILQLLKDIDLQELKLKIDEEIASKKDREVPERIIRRRDIVNMFLEGNTKMEDLVISVLPVIPAEIRPIIYLEGGGIATMDINEQYRKIVSRNLRLMKLTELNTHKIIVNNEKYMINQAICQLIGPYKTQNIKSISEYIKGKKGYFRRALLGKRVDFSGRAAIVVGPSLNLDECCIPLAIATELFKPFIYSSLIKKKIATSVLEAKEIFDNRDQVVLEILNEIVQDFPIILNRAPTLHRLGMQSFKINLTQDHAIHIPPLVCTGYNADFDGDNMACYLPLALSSRVECYSLMMASSNLFLPSNGRLILLPTKDIVIGVYYLTMMSKRLQRWNKVITSKCELSLLLAYKKIATQDCVQFRLTDKHGTRVVITTPGRLQVFFAIDKREQVDFDNINKAIDKNDLTTVIMMVFSKIGHRATIDFLNRLTKMGFAELTQSGITYGVEDIQEVSDREERIEEIENKIVKLEDYYKKGMITSEEVESSSMKIWNEYIDQSGDQIIEEIGKQTNIYDENEVCGNNIYLMYISGARGSKSQIQQVCCVRGFMAKPSGQVGKFIIKSNLFRGLNIVEYFESTHGERKGLSDVAIKTSKSGHFTRRLIDVVHGVYVKEEYCKSEEFMTYNIRKDKRKFGINVAEAVFGKYLALDLIDTGGNVVMKAGTMISSAELEIVKNTKANEISVYSVLNCKTIQGVCTRCYGMDFSTYRSVDIGTPIGIIAAQSIGEPGTQLTMRTTHTGGVASIYSSELAVESEIGGRLDLSGLSYVKNKGGDTVVLTEGRILITDANNHVIDEIDVKPGLLLLKQHDEIVDDHSMLGYYNKNINTVYSLHNGTISFKDIVDGVTLNKVLDEETGITRYRVSCNVSSFDEILNPAIIITTEDDEQFTYHLEDGAFLIVQDEQKVEIGDVLCRIFITETKTHDITGGLPKIIDLFENKKSANKAIISKYDGTVCIQESKGIKKTKQVLIKDAENNTLEKIFIPTNRRIMVHDKAKVIKGTTIVDGDIYLQDLLDSTSFIHAVKYMMGSISYIYADQGVSINHTHLEVVIRQMMRCVSVTTRNDSRFEVYSIVDRYIVEQECEDLKAEGKIPCQYKQVILGITKVALNHSNSFISSSSFQHTISIIANAAIAKKRDFLAGIKENVIFGKTIPVGTGYKDFC